MIFARLSTWILVSGIAMLGIILIVNMSKWIGSKSIPVVSPVATGVVSAWRAAA